MSCNCISLKMMYGSSYFLFEDLIEVNVNFCFQAPSSFWFHHSSGKQYKSQPFFIAQLFKVLFKEQGLTVHRISNCLWPPGGQHQRTENIFCPSCIESCQNTRLCQEVRQFSVDWQVSSVNGQSRFPLMYWASMQWGSSAPWGKGPQPKDYWFSRSLTS